MDTETQAKQQEEMWWEEVVCTGKSIPAGLWYPMCHAVPSRGWIGWQTHYPSVTAEWVGVGEWLGTGQPLWCRLEVLKSFILKGKINDTINPCLGHCRGGQGRIHTRCWLPSACSTHAWNLLICTHIHRCRHTQLLCTQTHFPLDHLICQVSIWPQVVMELEAVACIFVAGSYLMEVIGPIFTSWWESEREAERKRGWQTQWISNRCGWHQSDCRPVFSAVATVKLERNSGLLTLWWDREPLGVSVCASGRLALCSCWRTRQEQMGTKKKDRHGNTR